MKKKKLEEKDFSWDSISINKYYDICDILYGEDGKDEDDITKNVRLVALMLGKDEDEIWGMDLTAASSYISKLQFLTQFDIPKHLNMKVILPHYRVRVAKDLTKMTVGQYVDFQHFVTLPMREGIDKILSIFLIPEGCTYNDGYDILDLQREIRECMSFRIAQGMLGFILRRSADFQIHMLISLQRQMKKMKRKKMADPALIKEMEEKIEQTKKQLGNLGSIFSTGSY